MSLYNKALLVSLNIGMPPASKTLKVESEEVTYKHRAEINQAKVVGKLFAKQDIRGLQKIATQARSWFRQKTLPYGRSQGIIPAKIYFDFLQDVGALRLQFNAEKQAMIDNIEEVLKNAQEANGTLFHRDNYPSLQELESNIYFSISCNPVPASNDYDKLADLTPEEIEVLKNEAVIDAQTKMQTAVHDLFGRLLRSLSHAADRLQDDDEGMKIFRESLVGNINKAVEAAEILNIEDDGQLQEFTDKVKDIFDGVTAADLRRDANLRKETATKAADLASKISELF